MRISGALGTGYGYFILNNVGMKVVPMKKQDSRPNDKPGERREKRNFLISLLMSLVAIAATFVVPEVRHFFGLTDGDQQVIVVADSSKVQNDTIQESRKGKQAPDKEAGSKRADPGKVNPGKVAVYRGIVVDSLQRPVGGVRVVCANCETQQAFTNDAGQFELKKRFSEEDYFRQESVSFSKADKMLTLYLNWREVTPIKF